ncbi:hypothetical protein EGY19_07510 [Burkholderia multivorans]|nr:hypothetical protein EGY19_07510 [Burkholderia multivorans]
MSAFMGDAHRRDPRRIGPRTLRALDEMARRDASAARANGENKKRGGSKKRAGSHALRRPDDG